MKVLKTLLTLLLSLMLILGTGVAVWHLYGYYQRWMELSQNYQDMESELRTVNQRIEELQSELVQMKQESERMEQELQNQMAESEASGTEAAETVLPVIEITIEDISQMEAGTVISDLTPVWEQMDSYFQSYEISDEVFARIQGKSYGNGCDIPLENLRYLKVLHYDFEHQVRVGELIVNTMLTGDFLEIFKELFRNEYEIQSMYLVDNFEADDYMSIEANNTSAFNYRLVSGGSTLSNHALGCAIDINPQQNPYVEADGTYYHSNAAAYVGRENRDHMITHEDLCYKLFTERGFTWGGDWSNPRDYQHFEKKVYQ